MSSSGSLTTTDGMYECVVIGIGAMGGGMARALMDSALVRTVVGYDVHTPSVLAFWQECQAVGKPPPVPPTCLENVLARTTMTTINFVILSLVNEAQCEQVCFGTTTTNNDDNDETSVNLLQGLPPGCCVILTSTVTATWARRASTLFGTQQIHFVDAPVSGGPTRARMGDLTVLASGDDVSRDVAKSILLDVLAGDLYWIEGGAGAGSTVKCVHQLLAGVQICAAAEALALAAAAGVDVEQVYRIVNGATAGSWMFTDRGQRMLEQDPPVKSALNIFVKDLEIVHSEAKRLQTPIPVASAALQQFISGQSLGFGKLDDSQVVKVYETFTKAQVARVSSNGKSRRSASGSYQSNGRFSPRKFECVMVGVGNIGSGMARSLLRDPCTSRVIGYDINQEAVATFYQDAKLAGKAGPEMPKNLRDSITKSTNVVFLALVDEMQCEEVCFGGHGNDDGENLRSLMPPGSCVVLTSTVSPTWVRRACHLFEDASIEFIDCPALGTPARANDGTLTLLVSCDTEPLQDFNPVLEAISKELHVIVGKPGRASTVRCIHQLLVGIHVCAAAEAMAMAAKAGMDLEQLYKIVNGAAGASWMFTERGKRMLSPDPSVVNLKMDILVKDLVAVSTEARRLKCPIPVLSASTQQFISAQSLGLGKQDDSQVVRAYECVTKASVVTSKERNGDNSF